MLLQSVSSYFESFVEGTERWAHKALEWMVICVTFCVSLPYCQMLERGTRRPIEQILENTVDDEVLALLKQWSQYKWNEASYVQVAGAVMFASVTGCMSWDAVKTSHWAGRAFWESSLIFAICAILTGAQQTLYLGTSTLVAQLSSREIRELKRSLASRGNKSAVQKACPLVVFHWQAPLMLLCYAVVCFLAGLCSIVYSPLVRALQWNADARVALLFSIVAVVCAFSWVTASLAVFRLRVPGQMLTALR